MFQGFNDLLNKDLEKSDIDEIEGVIYPMRNDRTILEWES